jgi:hypothetical protein
MVPVTTTNATVTYGDHSSKVAAVKTMSSAAIPSEKIVLSLLAIYISLWRKAMFHYATIANRKSTIA